MDALQFYAIAFILIWVVALLFRDKLKVDVHGPLLMRKTQRMRGFIDRVANIKFTVKPRSFNINLGFKKFTLNIGPTISPWRVILNAGIPVAFLAMFYTLIFLVNSLQYLFVAPQVSLVLPGVDIPGAPSVPLISGIIGLITVIIVHEFGHGILARVEGVRIKSIGVLLLAVLPGAFVEPDEEDIEKSSRLSKLRIYAAGSVFNLMLALLCFILLTGVANYAIPGTFETEGMQIDSVVTHSPAMGILKEGMIIQSINGYSTSNYTKYSEVLTKIKLGDTVTIKTDQGTYTIKTGQNPNNASKAYIGIRTKPNFKLTDEMASTYGNLPWIWVYIYEVFMWIFNLNLAIGIINLLPMKPLDGGLMFEELLSSKLSEKIVQPVMMSLKVFIGLILVVSIIVGTGKGIMIMLNLI